MGEIFIEKEKLQSLLQTAAEKTGIPPERLAEKLAPVIANVMGTKQGYKVLTRQSGRDRNNDGIKNDNYYGELHGARLANVPGIILEHSFHTNLRSTNWLLDDSNLDKLAKRFFVSKYHLCRAFKKHNGISVHGLSCRQNAEGSNAGAAV